MKTASSAGQARRLCAFLMEGDSDTMNKLIYAFKDCGHYKLAKKYLRNPTQDDSWCKSDATDTGERNAQQYVV